MLRIGHRNGGEICGGDFKHRYVSGRIGADDLGSDITLSVGQANLHFVGSFNHMIVAENVPFG